MADLMDLYINFERGVNGGVYYSPMVISGETKEGILHTITMKAKLLKNCNLI